MIDSATLADAIMARIERDAWDGGQRCVNRSSLIEVVERALRVDNFERMQRAGWQFRHASPGEAVECRQLPELQWLKVTADGGGAGGGNYSGGGGGNTWSEL